MFFLPNVAASLRLSGSVVGTLPTDPSTNSFWATSGVLGNLGSDLLPLIRV